MMNVSGIVKSIKGMFNGSLSPAQSLPALLLLCTTLKRSGFSAIQTTSEIIQDFGSADIPTGKNPDNSDNLINVAVYCITNRIFKAIKQKGVVEVVAETGSIPFVGFGANGGGGMTVNGSNVAPVKLKGRIS